MQVSQIDILWIILCASLVFTMQAGFLCLESGLTRNKNAINVALKNVADFALAAFLFWLFGFALMFGDSMGGWIGLSGFLPELGSGSVPWLAAFFFFQVMFCATASTIVSGAVAERMRFASYMVVTALVAGLIYPVFGHWAWGGVTGSGSGWLADMGFVDFAGSTVVHSLGGWVALAGVIVVGSRTGRFVAGERPRVIPAGNLPMAMLGLLILFFGWFGFNGGSTLAMDGRVPGILVNTTLAAVGGILTGLLIGWRFRGYPEVLYALNGAIAGLVAITAGAHALSAANAVMVGGVGAILMVLCHEMLLRLRVDDAVGAIPAHLAAGIWGTLAVGLFGDLSALGTELERHQQVGVQLLGILVCGLWSFVTAYLLLRLINRLMPLRVTPLDESLGLNVSEHGARDELAELIQTMNEQASSGTLDRRVAVEPFTEVGQIAVHYNRLMDTLARAMDQTRAIIRDMKEGVMTFSRDGVLTGVNPGAEHLFGIPAARAVGKPVHLLFEGRDARTETGECAALPNPGERQAYRLKKHDGNRCTVEVSVTESQVGDQVMFTALVRDVTERRQVEEQLQRERDLARVTLASIGDGVITTDESGVIQYINPVAQRLTGVDLSEARGQHIGSVYRLVDEKTGRMMENPVRSVLSGGQPIRRHEHGLLRRRDGRQIPVQDSAAPIRSHEGFIMGVVLVIHDVTVTLNLSRELTYQARHDVLTGILNRRAFEECLTHLLDGAFESDTHHVLGYLDLDQFKVINDTCGHEAGDEALRQITALLGRHVRSADVLARLGGDEFGLLLRDCPMDKACQVAEAMRQSVQDFRFAWQDKSFSLGISIGLVGIGEGHGSLAALLSAADSACYAAKEAGRSQVHVYQPDDQHLLEQHGQVQWVSRLQSALDEDRFRLYVQPIVPLVAGCGCVSVHYEVLLRLREGDQIISPGSFIPAAERYQMMPRIDQWVVRNVLAWLSDNCRRSGGLDGTWCVNLSGASLSDDRFRQSLKADLEQLALPPGTLCLEITESAAIGNLSKVVPFIREVRHLGCLFALDDFGSGLSSFGYLKNLPVDYLKIDGAFVKDIAHDPVDLAMVRAINTIGHEMGLKTIAEFVENEEIMDALGRIGVDFVQGYHIGRPRPLHEIAPVRLMPR